MEPTTSNFACAPCPSAGVMAHSCRNRYSRHVRALIEPLAVPVLAEIVVSVDAQPNRPLVDHLIAASLPDVTRRRALLLAVRPQLAAVLDKVPGGASGWLLPQLAAFGSIADLQAARGQPAHFLAVAVVLWLRHQ